MVIHRVRREKKEEGQNKKFNNLWVSKSDKRTPLEIVKDVSYRYDPIVAIQSMLTEPELLNLKLIVYFIPDGPGYNMHLLFIDPKAERGKPGAWMLELNTQIMISEIESALQCFDIVNPENLKTRVAIDFDRNHAPMSTYKDALKFFREYETGVLDPLIDKYRNEPQHIRIFIEKENTTKKWHFSVTDESKLIDVNLRGKDFEIDELNNFFVDFFTDFSIIRRKYDIEFAFPGSESGLRLYNAMQSFLTDNGIIFEKRFNEIIGKGIMRYDLKIQTEGNTIMPYNSVSIPRDSLRLEKMRFKQQPNTEPIVTKNIEHYSERSTFNIDKHSLRELPGKSLGAAVIEKIKAALPKDNVDQLPSTKSDVPKSIGTDKKKLLK